MRKRMGTPSADNVTDELSGEHFPKSNVEALVRTCLPLLWRFNLSAICQHLDDLASVSRSAVQMISQSERPLATCR